MMKQRIFFRLPVLALALAGFFMFSACPTDVTTGGGRINKDNLENKIAEAKAERDNTVVGTNEYNVPLGKYLVTSEVMLAFQAAIAKAEIDLASATRQPALDSAERTLDTALKTFKSARRSGKGTPVDTSALAAKITEAENAKAAVVVNTSAANVAAGMYWVTQAEMDAFDGAINMAKATRDTATSQQAVTSAVSTLDSAIYTFSYAFKSGAKNSGFSAEELDALIVKAQAIKANVKTSVNGNDVGPADSWVSQSVLNTLNTAITNAESAAGPNFDSQYLSLVAAINNFNTAKTTGTIPNKTSLYNALINASNAKENVAEAASAAQAPLGSSWATAAQWAALNAAYDSALAVYGNANSSQVMVTEETSALFAAIQTFTAAVSANGLGTKANSIKITGLSAHNGKVVEVYLFETQDEFDTAAMGQGESKVSGYGEIENGEVTVTLMSGYNVWAGTGSWYAGLIILDITDEIDMSSIAFYISKSTVDFTANSNPSKAFNDFERYVFSVRLGDMTGDEVFEGGQMTLDNLVLLMSDGEMNYNAMVQDTGMTFYKNKALTQPFTGADQVGANTIIYSPFPLWNSAPPPAPSLPAPTGLTVTGTTSTSVSLSWNAVPGAQAYWIYRNTNPSFSGSSVVEYHGLTSYTNTGLSPNTTYYYWVAAQDFNDVEGNISDNVSATTQSGGVGNFPPSGSTPLSNGVWADGNITSSTQEVWYSFQVSYGNNYYIWWDDSDNSSKTADIKVAAYFNNGTEIFDNDNGGHSFYATSTGTVYVKAYRYYSNGTYAVAYSTSNTRPGGEPVTPGLSAPYYLYAYAQSSTSIYLSWYYVNGSDGCKIYRSTNEYGPYYYVDSAYSSEWYLDEGLSPGTTYYYRITAFNESTGEESDWSFISATTQDPFSIPANSTPLSNGVWANGNITSSTPNREAWYSFNVTYGALYYIWMNTSYQGDNSKTMDAVIDVYYSTGDNIVSQKDGIWNNSFSFTANTTGTVYIRVYPFSSGSDNATGGTYGVVYSTSSSRP